MNWINTITLFAASILIVFCEAYLPMLRRIVGAQIDLLPALIVYASLYAGLATTAALAFVAGLSFDSLSANPLGITVIPLLLCGILIYVVRELILRDQTFAQVILGTAASLITPILVLLILLTMHRKPLVGFGTAWQLAVMTIAGAIATPIVFVCFGYLNRLFGYREVTSTSFRPDREIRRGR
jgi:rod shape-determining protein MreD